jgi:nucleoside-diphosphate-sugar epimerase
VVTTVETAATRRAAEPDDLVLVTGANGFIGSRVVEALLSHGFRRIRCLVRSATGQAERLRSLANTHPAAHVELFEGNLKSQADCRAAARDVRVVFHLAAGIAEKSFPGCVLNTVVTTRNLLEALGRTGVLTRVVNVSSLAVYSNFGLGRRAEVDETCPLETNHVARSEPYSYAKLKQDELVTEYAARYGFSYVILRPGAVYGPGKPDITGRIGIGTFGMFLHLGGRNRIPFTHVTNCAEAIVLAGLTEGVDGHVLNVIDDDLPTGKQFMAEYQKHVGPMSYLSVPYPVFYLFCCLWERYSRWSEGQLPPAFNRRRCSAYWKGNRYSNRRLKELTGWRPRVSFRQAAPEYFGYLKQSRTARC